MRPACIGWSKVASLNYVGFRKVIKKARKRLGKEACDAAGMPDTDQLKSHAFYLEKHETSAPEAARFFANVEVRPCPFCEGVEEQVEGETARPEVVQGAPNRFPSGHSTLKGYMQGNSPTAIRSEPGAS